MSNDTDLIVGSGLANLASALVKFQAEMQPVLKEDANPFFKSKYAGLPSVVKQATPLLTKNGLAVIQQPSYELDTHKPTLKTMLVHTSGEYIESEMLLMMDKDTPQGQGSAITYARRYAYCAVLGIVADEDDDGEKAEGRSESKRRVQDANTEMTSEQLTSLAGLAVRKGVATEFLDHMTVEQGRREWERLVALPDIDLEPGHD
jgi:hypothetical protein